MVVTSELGPNVTTKIVWDGRVEGTADDAMQEQREKKSDVAKKWLLKRLSAGPVLVNTLKEEVEALGDVFSWSAVKRAGDDIANEGPKGV